MGNCQAIDAATLVIQHPSGKVDKLYWPVLASEIMKMNPGHYVALLITTTICHTTSKTETNTPTKTNNNNNNNNNNSSNNSNNSNNSNSQKNNSNSRSSSNNSSKKSNSNSRGSSNNNSQNNSKNTDNKSNSTSTGDGRNTVRITRVKLLRPTDTLALGHVYRLICTQEVMKGLVAKKQAKMRKNGIELADSEGLKEAEILARRSQQEKEKTHQVNRHGHRSRTTSGSNGGTAKPKTWQPALQSISEAAS
ncbi:uncharacterized protein LOC104894219 [Beta vulgaris subsp. vulgaris]|uniref:uncharacterized protein LOC104894219 n=1 Tax=Beta vulgaris subsp. vulgaris TaxID=3555 RepID=UPI0025475DE4|nr:uncharacterized protein LOC104894219 [Beta vulgaris subsp. vulgaris]